VCLIGVDLTGVYLIDVDLTGVLRISLCLYVYAISQIDRQISSSISNIGYVIRIFTVFTLDSDDDVDSLHQP